ncbi:MAG: recombination protein RmuC, partial [Pseudomonadota bacterium]|nr:recombination protein RmuC [Pseudomonadota bacterium]
MQALIPFAGLLLGLLLGGVATVFFMRARFAATLSAALNEGQISEARLNERLQHLQEENRRLGDVIDENAEDFHALRSQLNASEHERAQLAERVSRISVLEKEKAQLATEKEALSSQSNELHANIATLTAQLDAQQVQSIEKVALLSDAKDQLSNQFKVLANSIFEEKSRQFNEQNQSSLDNILSPLKIKLHEFQGKVEEVYVQEGKERSALAQQVKQLMELNQQLSSDAHNLTNALKGQAKTQGNWGEFILERVLENAGLIKGNHYKTQESHTREDGSRAQPDVIIYLPEGKHLVIDSKVSIVAYNDYANSDDEAMKNAALKRHIESIKTHIAQLSSKNYHDLYQLKSLDFVIMFIPIEPAFMLAVTQDSEIWQQAWTKNVLLVSPSTLLFVVRTISHLWRQEQQTQNAQDIAKRGGQLYDKLVGFVADLEEVGKRI